MLGIDFDKIEQIVQSTIEEYGQRIFDEAMAKLKSGEVRSTWSITKSGNRVELYSDNNISAYIEFGTGQFAKNYLSGQSEEMKEDAMKFYVNGQGTMDAQPYLFPVYYKYKNELVIEMDKRVQRYLDTIKI